MRHKVNSLYTFQLIKHTRKRFAANPLLLETRIHHKPCDMRGVLSFQLILNAPNNLIVLFNKIHNILFYLISRLFLVCYPRVRLYTPSANTLFYRQIDIYIVSCSPLQSNLLHNLYISDLQLSYDNTRAYSPWVLQGSYSQW